MPLYTIKQISELHPGIKARTLESWIYYSRGRLLTVNGERTATEPNGFHVALMRAGRRVLIDSVLMMAWLKDKTDHHWDEGS